MTSFGLGLVTQKISTLSMIWLCQKSKFSQRANRSHSALNKQILIRRRWWTSCAYGEKKRARFFRGCYCQTSPFKAAEIDTFFLCITLQLVCGLDNRSSSELWMVRSCQPYLGRYFVADYYWKLVLRPLTWEWWLDMLSEKIILDSISFPLNAFSLDAHKGI